MRLCDEWDSKRTECSTLLHQHEAELQASAQALFDQLQQECASYNGFPEAELQDMLQKECAAMLSERQQAAQGLLAAADRHLEAQGQAWRSAAQCLSAFWLECAQAVAQHDADNKAVTKQVRQKLKSMQQEFESADKEREVALSEALTALKQAFSEADLDAKVADALKCLAAIQQGYRDAGSAMTAVSEAHPGEMQRLHHGYERSLCTLLRLKPRASEAQASGTGATQADAAADAVATDDAVAASLAAEDAEASAAFAVIEVPPHVWQVRKDLLADVLVEGNAADEQQDGQDGPVEGQADHSAEPLAGSPGKQEVQVCKWH